MGNDLTQIATVAVVPLLQLSLLFTGCVEGTHGDGLSFLPIYMACSILSSCFSRC